MPKDSLLLMRPRTNYGWRWPPIICPYLWTGSRGLILKQPSCPLFQAAQNRGWSQPSWSTPTSTDTVCLSKSHGIQKFVEEQLQKVSCSYATTAWKGSHLPNLAFVQLLRALLSNHNIMLLEIKLFNWRKWNIISAELHIAPEHNVLNFQPTLYTGYTASPPLLEQIKVMYRIQRSYSESNSQGSPLLQGTERYLEVFLWCQRFTQKQQHCRYTNSQLLQKRSGCK